jgi:CRP-like cAMP-binding protein
MSPKSNSYTQLKRFSLLSKLPASELKRIHALSRELSFKSGQMIFQKAEAGAQMFVVLSGRIKIFSRSGWKKRKTFAYLEKGDFFGEMAVIEDKARSAAAQAVEPSTLLLIPKKDFRQLILSDSKLCFQLLKAVSDRLRKANEEIESLLFRNILGRVAKTLYDLSGARKRRGSGPITIKQRYTHQDLADLVGTTREPLSRALAILRKGEFVATKNGLLVLPEPKRLETLIHNSVRDD